MGSLSLMPKQPSCMKPSWAMGIDFGEVKTDISNETRAFLRKIARMSRSPKSLEPAE